MNFGFILVFRGGDYMRKTKAIEEKRGVLDAEQKMSVEID